MAHRELLVSNMKHASQAEVPAAAETGAAAARKHDEEGEATGTLAGANI